MPRSSVDFNALITSTPINKTAALVTSKGFEYVPDKSIIVKERDAPFDIVKINKGEIDLSGIRFGRFLVVGRTQLGKRYALWSCRCDCGTFAVRRAKAINNQNNKKDRCEKCRHLSYLKRSDEFLATGKNAGDGKIS